MKPSLFTTLVPLPGILAFPFIGNPSTNTLAPRQQAAQGHTSAAQCPFNPNHEPAARCSSGMYNDARDGHPGLGRGGYVVPAAGDVAHEFRAPRAGIDIRGPCPGLNTAANHGFIARDGITDYVELVDALQNLFNVHHDLATLLAFLGVQADGDVVTGRLSIGCDATTRTAALPAALSGPQPGLAGHGHFEGDTSLTRTDYFLSPTQDTASLNHTLYAQLATFARRDGTHTATTLAAARARRWDDSQAANPHFFFGPLSIFLYGAASFVYDLMPSGPGYRADQQTLDAWFLRERLPAGWSCRVAPLRVADTAREMEGMFRMAPRPFGGNVAAGRFQRMDWVGIRDGVLMGGGGGGGGGGVLGMLGLGAKGNGGGAADGKVMACLLYQMATQMVPTSLNVVVTPTVEALGLFANQVMAGMENLGCPDVLT